MKSVFLIVCCMVFSGCDFSNDPTLNPYKEFPNTYEGHREQLEYMSGYHLRAVYALRVIDDIDERIKKLEQVSYSTEK